MINSACKGLKWNILQRIQNILMTLIFEFFVFLSCNGSEEKLHKYLGPAVLPESIGKMMAILNKLVSVDAL